VWKRLKLNPSHSRARVLSANFGWEEVRKSRNIPEKKEAGLKKENE